MISDVLQSFGIYFHQLTPNAIVRLSVYIWALRSQAVEPFADSFCRAHELHYQTKARKDGLHENFGCYNFAYRKTTKFPVISYRSKWPAGWKSEWFYVKIDEDKEKLVQSPLELIFGETRPRCKMVLEGPTWAALGEFKIIAEHIGTRDLVQEFLAFRVFPTMKEWTMPKLEGEKKEGELVRLPYHYKFKKFFKVSCQKWLDTIEMMSNEILGNYSKKEDQLMTAAFGTRPKRRLNRVLDAIGFEYADYGRLGGDAGGPKRKRIASATDEEVVKVAKKKKKDSENLSAEELNPEPKVATSRKRKGASPEPETPVREEDIPASPSAVEVEEIMKVMTEPLPIRLSPLALELTKFFQKDKAASAAESPAKPKKRRIIQVTDVIHQTPPPATVPKIPFAETAEAEATGMKTTEAETSETEATGAEAGATEESNLETTLEVIDNILLKMAEEEATVAAVNTATEKGKEQIDEISEGEDFNFQDLLGQELTDAEKEELKKYAISCGYKSGAMLFGGVNEGKLRCLRNRTEAKIVRTLSKSIGLPKVEADLCRYQRHHIAGSLLYTNFKVTNIFVILLLLLLTFGSCSNEDHFDRAYY
jgi:hypothetical protein